MNRKTLMLVLAFLILCWGASSVFAKGSSHPKAGAGDGSVIDAQWAPRAIIWDDNRTWQGDDGRILICPWKYKIATAQWRDRECLETVTVGKNSKEVDRWMRLQDYKIDGHVLVGYEFRFVGSSGNRMLVAYYGPIPTPEPAAAPASAPAPAPAPTTLKVDQLTIKADKVIVRRR